jgi:hypothetical protein
MDSKASHSDSTSVYQESSLAQDSIRHDEKHAIHYLSESRSTTDDFYYTAVPFRRIISEFGQRSRPIRSLVSTFGVFTIFACLYCVFVYYVLIRGEVIVGNTLFDASTTNLLVSIFSQISALLADTALRQLLASLRMLFASSRGGTSAYTWFGIGPSSQWMSTAKFAIASYLLNAWCLLRYDSFQVHCHRSWLTWLRMSLPILNLAYGSVLKCTFTLILRRPPSA